LLFALDEKDEEIMNPEAEKIRIRYKYRRMILRGEIKVPHEAAKKLIGPDCAYHLYGIYQGEGPSTGSGQGEKGEGENNGET
jgi:hypothetical protein